MSESEGDGLGGWLGPLTVAGIVLGFIHGGGIVGSITGGATVYLATCALAIVAGEDWIGNDRLPGRRGTLAERLGGITATVSIVALSVWFGWSWGWAGAIAGYAAGMLASVIFGMMGG